LLRREKTRRRFLAELDHFRWLDARYSTAVARGLQFTDQIESLLRQLGAPSDCIVISSDKRQCGRATLSKALSTVVGGSSGAVVSCIPGELAYYEAEEPFERFVCQRVPGAK